jgi:hypothetical protein
MKKRGSPRLLNISWGRTEVEGVGSGKDFKLYPGGGRAGDWRETKTEHVPGIQPVDVLELLDKGSRVVVLSRGMQSMLQTCPETLRLLKDKGVGVHVEETRKAAEVYNRWPNVNRSAACSIPHAERRDSLLTDGGCDGDRGPDRRTRPPRRDRGTTGSRYNTYILESDQLTGPWKLVVYMHHFGEQGYFVNIPTKFVSADGRTAWLCYSANFTRPGVHTTVTTCQAAITARTCTKSSLSARQPPTES